MCCFLYPITSFFDLDFMSLFFNWVHFIIAERSVLLTCFWLPRRIFLLFGACLSKSSTKHFSKVQYSWKVLYKLHVFSLLINSKWKFENANSQKSRQMSIFGSSSWNVVLDIEYLMWWWSLKPVSKVQENLKWVLAICLDQANPEPIPFLLKHYHLRFPVAGEVTFRTLVLLEHYHLRLALLEHYHLRSFTGEVTFRTFSSFRTLSFTFPCSRRN